MMPSTLRFFQKEKWLNYRIRLTKHWFFGLSFLLLQFISVQIDANPYVPIYIEDSHAGSYYFFVEQLNLEKEYQLILFDKHSDANEAFDSDSIREKVRAAKEDYSLEELFQTWRSRGIIQCYNWIEPLMPKPFASVVWVAGDNLSNRTINHKKIEAEQQLNCHEEAIGRECGSLANCFQVTDFSRLQKIKSYKLPLVVSIDLDYFTGLNEVEQSKELKKVFNYTFSLPNLQAVSIAVSYPYLQSSQEADRLLYLTLRYLNQIKNCKLRFEPFRDNGPDRSELAKSYYQKRLPVPKYEIEKASDSIKSLLLKMNLQVDYHRDKWQTLVLKWQNHLNPKPEIVIYKNQQKTLTERCNYFSIKDEIVLKVSGVENLSGFKVVWKVLYPKDKSINLTEGKYGFADNAPKCINFAEKRLSNRSIELKTEDLIESFDSKTGFGTIRVFAEIVYQGSIYRSDLVCLSRCRDQSYLGKLTEIFNLPYILGSSLLREGNLVGPDLMYGADCSNFIIYGKRRQGINIPYLNPSQLKDYLVELGKVTHFQNGIAFGEKGKIPLNEALIKDGLLLHFGAHLVAVYQDNEPCKVLDHNDLIIHQLEGFPEIVPIKNIKQAESPFEVMRFM